MAYAKIIQTDEEFSSEAALLVGVVNYLFGADITPTDDWEVNIQAILDWYFQLEELVVVGVGGPSVLYL